MTVDKAYWSAVAAHIAIGAEIAANRAVLLSQLVICQLRERLLQSAVLCELTQELEPCIATAGKARTWASKILKSNCITKNGSLTSDPDLSKVLDSNSMVPLFGNKTGIRKLKYPADFMLLYKWTRDHGLSLSAAS